MDRNKTDVKCRCGLSSSVKSIEKTFVEDKIEVG